MRSRRSRLRTPAALLTLTALLLAGLAVIAPAARANTEPVDLSTVEAITAYLDSKGVDTTNLVVQEGFNNYYGPGCPGEGWTCAEPGPPGSNEVVIQRSSEGANIFEPEFPSSACVVVQTNDAGDNSATCSQYSGDSTALSAVVAQQDANGMNESSVSQYSELYDLGFMNLAQAADVHQQIVNEGAGTNSSEVYQEIVEDALMVAPASQTQLSSQSADLDQFSNTGSNASSLTQYLDQNADVIGLEGEQHQNDAGEQEYQRNRVNQQSVSGANTSVLDNQTYQYASITPPGVGEGDPSPSPSPAAAAAAEEPVTATQLQGCEACGIIGSLSQSSAGISTATATLDEYQEVMVDPAIANPLQIQIGPVAVPGNRDIDISPVNGVRCCSDQSGNPYNIFDVTITSTQVGDHADSQQTNYVRASCTTSGSCVAGTTVSQDGVATTETCTGSDCSIAVQCPAGDDCSQTDSAQPDTAITSGPASPTASDSATFEFTGTEPGGFICALDEGEWEACTSPAAYGGLADGSHLFRVSALDIAGNVDQTPAALSWLINTAVDTTIDSAPTSYTNKTSATLTFHGTETAASFQCKLDGAEWTACASPATYHSLTAGRHTFSVRAIDGAGRADPSPAIAVWIIDLGKPISIWTTRTGARKVGTPFGDDTVAGKAFDTVGGIDRVVVTFKAAGVLARTTHATLSCNPARTACTWETSVFGLPPGPYTVRKEAFDRAGNSDDPSSITIIVI